MNKNRIFTLILTVLMILALLTGCGASGKASDTVSAAPQERTEAAESWDEPAAGGIALPENRKWIVTMELYTETEDLDDLLTRLSQRIGELEGYVEGQRIYNGSSSASRRYRNADMTIRIPAQQVDAFTQAVSGMANLISSNRTVEDVTLSYTDTESHIAALETEQERLLELMENAETMADLLEIEARLTDVRYELERYGSQLRLYDNQIDYATIYLTAEEVTEYTPVESTVWQRISGGFVSSLKGLGTGAVDLLVFLIAASPYLLVFGCIGGGVFALVRKGKKRRSAKKVGEGKDQA